MLLDLRLLYEVTVEEEPFPTGVKYPRRRKERIPRPPRFEEAAEVLLPGIQLGIRLGRFRFRAGGSVELPSARSTFEPGSALARGSARLRIPGTSAEISNSFENEFSSVTLGARNNFDLPDDSEAIATIFLSQ